MSAPGMAGPDRGARGKREMQAEHEAAFCPSQIL